jgi:hypothetical protein
MLCVCVSLSLSFCLSLRILHAVSLRSETRVCACSGLVRFYDTGLASKLPFIALRLHDMEYYFTLTPVTCLLNKSTLLDYFVQCKDVAKWIRWRFCQRLYYYFLRFCRYTPPLACYPGLVVPLKYVSR